MKLVKLLANLGYGSRKESEKLIRSGVITNLKGEPYGHKDSAEPVDVLVAGEEIDPISPLIIIMNKPIGFTCSKEDPGETVYDLLPPRFSNRNPGLNPVGRLDKDTTGMLLMTDDGKFLHQVIHPKSGCLKVYHVSLDRPLEGIEGDVFSSGELVLESDTKPLLPAGFETLGEKEALLTLHEGRYHQVRRMFAAVGNHVLDLKRISIGGLKLPEELEEGEWRIVSKEEVEALFTRSKDSSSDGD
ncbi:MAG: pseudouridine synthase [Akkermansiaceae bacterium]